MIKRITGIGLVSLLVFIATPAMCLETVKQFEETSYYLKDVDFINTNVGWAGGAPHWDQAQKAYRTTIIKTSDGGETWVSQNAGGCETIRGIDFVDADNGWAVGTHGTILRTSDGGDHWVTQTIAGTDEFRGVIFVDVNRGWATSVRPIHYDFWGNPDNWQGSIWHTSDGGQTWDPQSVPASAAILNRIDFVDSLNGWAVGVKYIGSDQNGDPEHRAAVYHTSDGGQTWDEQYVPDLKITFTGVSFVDADTGWVVGFPNYIGMVGGTIFYTEDGGVTWERQEPNASFWDVRFLDSLRGYAVGFDYIGAQGPPVYRTLDGGASWEKVLMRKHDNEGVLSVAVTADRVIGVGDYSYLCISTDPWGTYEWPWGENLFVQEYIGIHYRFEDVFFVDDAHGWAVGRRSFLPQLWGQVIFHTSDGGVSWETQYEKAPPLGQLFNYNFRLDSVFFTDAQTGWAVGGSEQRQDAILHTTDGGLNWTEQGSELFGSWDLEFFAVQFIDSDTGWALAAERFPYDTVFLAHTTDGGTHWQWVDTGIEDSGAVGFELVQGDLTFTDDHHGWAVCGLGKIVHTEDGGTSWAQQTLPSAYRRVFAVDFLNNQVGWIAGEGLYQTTNGGTTWAEQDTGLDVDFQDIQFLDSLNGLLAGDSGVAMHTENAGNTWDPIDSGTSCSLRGISFINPQKGWLVGDHGRIISVFAPQNMCNGDFDGDGDVDGSDLSVFAADFGRTDCGSAPPCEGDFDGNGDVDGTDLAKFAADFGRTDCP